MRKSRSQMNRSQIDLDCNVFLLFAILSFMIAGIIWHAWWG
jgi:hypothetical protein